MKLPILLVLFHVFYVVTPASVNVRFLGKNSSEDSGRDDSLKLLNAKFRNVELAQAQGNMKILTSTPRTTPFPGECYEDSQCFAQFQFEKPFCDTYFGAGFCVDYCRSDGQCRNLYGSSWICQIYDTDYGYCVQNC